MARRESSRALLALRRAVRVSADDAQLVLIGCSGGADSLALAGAAALELPGRAGLVSIDHGLAPGSRERAEGIAELGARLGLAPSLSIGVEVAPDGSGLEAAARDARLAALSRAAIDHGAAAVWLAHTRDDQAEGVLLGLARGSGARSLAGMRPTRGIFGRPFLDLPRATVRQACADLGLTPWEDPHNSDSRFARSRVRHHVLPVLEDQLGPGVADALARSARLLAEDADALDAWSQSVAGTTEWSVEVGVLTDLPVAVRKRVLRLVAQAAGARSLAAAHAEALEDLVGDWHGQGPVALPGGVAGFRRTGRIEFEAWPARG